MLRLAAHCKLILAEKAHPWRKQQITAINPIIYSFLVSSIAPFSSSSSKKSSSLQNHYIRKRRKWPIKPFETQRHDAFALRLAKQSFKQSIRRNKIHLLSDLISSFSAYEINPNPQSYHLLFKILIQKRPPNWTDQISQILDHIEKVESFETPESIFTDLIKFYGDVRMFNDAIELFSRIPRLRCVPSVEVLNALLTVLCRDEKGLEMVPQVLVTSSEVMKIRIEESTFGVLIKALCKIGNSNNAYDLLNHMVAEGFGVDRKICSLMLATMCRQINCNGNDIIRFVDDLKKLGFEPKRDDFRNVIGFLVRKGKCMDALGLFKQMKLNRIRPDIPCYNFLLDGLIRDRDFSRADKLFDELLVLGLNPDIHTYNVYISGLIVQKKIDDGIRILNSMEDLGCKPGPSTYCSILRALCEVEEMGRVIEFLNEMRGKCMQINGDMYEILIDGFVSNGDVNGAFSFIREMFREKFFVPRRTSLGKIVNWLCETGMCSKAMELLGEEVVKGILETKGHVF
ncbi:pentatricopeptide repeat-containing family protein [Striga asiatica]|uniref:Pentatricopeptide repeat-containing family protein n=1 Tax=Striga asiatica TaxID=4170 RepID=A0A5A7RE87_STRAF|nr:pentatricopeptide repeat-containing family protein [Striga asiatica]